MLINVILLRPSWLSSICDSFRKLEEVHNNFMDEKDRIITEIYNESKERARWLQPELCFPSRTHMSFCFVVLKDGIKSESVFHAVS